MTNGGFKYCGYCSYLTDGYCKSYYGVTKCPYYAFIKDFIKKVKNK